MKVFSISDLHMDSSDEKPMSVFGGNWTNHMEKIKPIGLTRWLKTTLC